jgi:hypothetical protein
LAFQYVPSSSINTTSTTTPTAAATSTTSDPPSRVAFVQSKSASPQQQQQHKHHRHFGTAAAAPGMTTSTTQPQPQQQQQQYETLAQPAPGTPFHYAFPVHSLAMAKEFYGTVLGCVEGRSSEKWQDYALHGHQIVCHWVGDDYRCIDYYNPVDGGTF